MFFVQKGMACELQDGALLDGAEEMGTHIKDRQTDRGLNVQTTSPVKKPTSPVPTDQQRSQTMNRKIIATCFESGVDVGRPSNSQVSEHDANQTMVARRSLIVAVNTR